MPCVYWKRVENRAAKQCFSLFIRTYNKNCYLAMERQTNLLKESRPKRDLVKSRRSHCVHFKDYFIFL